MPRQLVKELQRLKESSGPHSNEATFVLGLCCAAGFGIERNFPHAIDLISESAKNGLWQARAFVKRAAMALNIPLGSDIEESAHDWLVECANKGAIFAKQDMALLAEENLKPSRPNASIAYSLPTTTQNANLGHTLIQAANRGIANDVEMLVERGADVNYQDESGVTALHYATIESSTVALRLLHLGADVLLQTTKAVHLSDLDLLGNSLPPSTSSLELSILIDNEALLEKFLETVLNSVGLIWNDILINLLSRAAEFQSIKCLRYLCERWPINDAPQFDQDGRTPLSYAIQSSVVAHLALYHEVPNSHDEQVDQSITPMLNRQLEVVKSLLDAGSTLHSVKDVLTNCLHRAAAESDTRILSALIKHDAKQAKSSLEQPSDDGLTPLGVAIRLGREDAVEILLNGGAKPDKAWPLISGSALHCCAMFPTEGALSIAKRLLKSSKKGLNARDAEGRTPLHCAAFREHSEMVEFLIANRASLCRRDNRSYTPLGAAISTRSIQSARLICIALQKRRLPFCSWKLMGLLSYSPMEQLLYPGRIPPARRPEMDLDYGSLSFGCCDFPFSEPSQNVLRLLLNHYEENWNFGDNVIELIFFPAWSYSGIHPAICMGNIDAVKIIMESKKFHHDFRRLAVYAHNQRMLSGTHIASEETRLRMVNLMEEYQKNEFLRLRKQRISSSFSLFWLAYYKSYGDLEQKQFERALCWLRENRRYMYRPALLEFLYWLPTRYSVILVTMVLLWIFLTPAIVYFFLILPDPLINFDRHDKTIAALMLVMVSLPTNERRSLTFRIKLNFFVLFPQTFSVLSVLYRSCRRSYQGNDVLLIILQMTFCWFTVLGSGLLVYAMQPEQHVIFEEFLRGLSPAKRHYLSTFGSLCQAMEGIIVAVPM